MTYRPLLSFVVKNLQPDPYCPAPQPECLYLAKGVAISSPIRPRTCQLFSEYGARTLRPGRSIINPHGVTEEHRQDDPRPRRQPQRVAFRRAISHRAARVCVCVKHSHMSRVRPNILQETNKLDRFGDQHEGETETEGRTVRR